MHVRLKWRNSFPLQQLAADCLMGAEGQGVSRSGQLAGKSSPRGSVAAANIMPAAASARDSGTPAQPCWSTGLEVCCRLGGGRKMRVATSPPAKWATSSLATPSGTLTQRGIAPRWCRATQPRSRRRQLTALPPLAAAGAVGAAADLLCSAAHAATTLQSAAQQLLGHDWGAVGVQLSLFVGGLPTALQPACFDAACEQQKDTLLVVSLAVPLLVFGAAVAYLLRPPPQGSLDDGTLFEDESTGFLFEAPPGTAPERDRRGELAFRPISYTPWPVEEGCEGERLRLEVGPVDEKQPRTYVFDKVLPQPSQLVVARLERPLGIVFEEDARKKRAFVAGFTPGGHAEQLVKRAKLNPSLAASAPLEGDVLRACTCTNIVYQQGAPLPKRALVVYGADGQGWPQTVAALKKGLLADGPVTLVLERRVQGEAVQQGAAGGRETAAAGREAASSG